MKTVVLTLLLSGSIFANAIIGNVNEIYFIVAYCIALSFLGIISFSLSGSLRVRRCTYGPFGSYDYFCISILLFFIAFLAMSGMLIIHSVSELHVVTLVLRLITAGICAGFVYAKLTFKEAKNTDTTY